MMPPSRSLALMCVLVSACADAPTQALQPPSAQLSAVKFWETTATTRWNRRAVDLFSVRTLANGQAAASRILTYLSIAQYRAALAAENGKEKSTHPSIAAAVGGASAVVLGSFFPLDVAFLESQLDADLAAEDWPGEKHRDDAAGEAVGRAVGAAVLAQAATDNYLVVPTGSPPVGPGFWIPNGPVVRSLHGVRPFFMTSASQLRSAPPPAFGSPAFQAALDEVDDITNNRTPEQLAIALAWNTTGGPFTAGSLNLIADDLIRTYHRKESDAARILAYANAAAFDAQIACWDSKLFYWTIRPAQANANIKLAFPAPNHPSYPSGHSCITGAVMTVLIDAFPAETERLNAIIEEAGMSRVYAGIHYRFDVEAGQEIGRGAAALAKAGKLE